MLSIFVREKNRREREKLFNCIHTHICVKKLDMEVLLCTAESEKILRHIEGVKLHGLYFLQLDGEEALAAAREIRKHDPRGFIVLLADCPAFLPRTFEYKLEALAYIEKGDEHIRQKIHECIEDAYDKHVSRPTGSCFIFKGESGRRISCEFDDILFFETEAPKRIILHAKKRRYKFYGTFNEIVQELPVGMFFSCHKSYIVNVGNVSDNAMLTLRQGNDKILMPDGADCLVSARKKGGLLKLLDIHKS